MSHETTNPDVYDPEHPWIRDAEDDPTRANWLRVFFDPVGNTRKPVFLRGQVLLFLLRTFVDVVVVGILMTGTFFPLSLIAGMMGMDIKLMQPIISAGAIVYICVFGLAAFASTVSHIRRLRDSHRSPLWAIVVPIPITLALAAFALTLLSPMPDPGDSLVPLTTDLWIMNAYSLANLTWLIAGVFVAPFTFFFVARGKSDIEKLDSF